MKGSGHGGVQYRRCSTDCKLQEALEDMLAEARLPGHSKEEAEKICFERAKELHRLVNELVDTYAVVEEWAYAGSQRAYTAMVYMGPDGIRKGKDTEWHRTEVEAAPRPHASLYISLFSIASLGADTGSGRIMGTEKTRVVCKIVPEALLTTTTLNISEMAGNYRVKTKQEGANGQDAEFINKVYGFDALAIDSMLAKSFAQIEKVFARVAEDIPKSFQDRKELEDFVAGAVSTSLEPDIFTAVALARLDKNYSAESGTKVDEVAKKIFARTETYIVGRILELESGTKLGHWALDSLEKLLGKKYFESDALDLDFQLSDLLSLVSEIRACLAEGMTVGMRAAITNVIDFRIKNDRWLSWESTITPGVLLFRESKRIRDGMFESDGVEDSVFEVAVSVMEYVMQAASFDPLNWEVKRVTRDRLYIEARADGDSRRL